MNKIIFFVLARLYGLYFNILALFSKKLAAEQAFTVYCSPRKGRVIDLQADFLNEAKDQLISIGGIKIQVYRWKGSKETVLLMHGWESNSFRWKNLIDYLQKEDYNVIAFDAPAHGNSSNKSWNVPIYADCAHRIITLYEPQFLIGHSLGGMAALFMQYSYPNTSISKIITIGAPSEFTQLMGYYKNLLGLSKRVMNGLNDYFKFHFGLEIKEFSTAILAKEIRIEGLLFHDRIDPITPYISSEKVHLNWKNSTLISTSGFGHSMHQEEVNLKILDFLNSSK